MLQNQHLSAEQYLLPCLPLCGGVYLGDFWNISLLISSFPHSILSVPTPVHGAQCGCTWPRHFMYPFSCLAQKKALWQMNRCNALISWCVWKAAECCDLFCWIFDSLSRLPQPMWSYYLQKFINHFSLPFLPPVMVLTQIPVKAMSLWLETCGAEAFVVVQ